MSMFSTHYLIKRSFDQQYWNGAFPGLESAWSQHSGIRIFAKEDAQMVLDKLIKPIFAGTKTTFHIVEGE